MPDNLDAEMTENDIIRQLIVEEQDAVISYTERAERVSNPKVRDVLLSIAEEEKVHAGELSALLSEYDPEHDLAMNEGRQEVEDMESEIEKAWTAFKSGNQTSVEDKIDVLLAQNQEIQVDTARTADLVPAVLGDRAMEDYEEDEGTEEEESEAVADDDPYAMLDGIADEGLESEGGPEDESDVIEEESDVVYEDGSEDGDVEESDVIDESEEESDVDYGEDGTEDDDTGDDLVSDIVDDESEDDDEPEEDESEEDSEEEEEDEEDDDEEDEEDVSKAVIRHAPRPTKTIKSFATPVRKQVVTKVSRPPVNVTMGRATVSEGMDAIREVLDQSEPIMFGPGVSPSEVMENDMKLLNVLKGISNL